MELKDILGEELTGRVTSSTDDLIKEVIGKLTTAKLIIGEAKDFVPKSEFNEKNELVKAQKAQLEKASTDLEGLKEKAAGNATLQQTITDLQNTNKAVKIEFEANQVKTKKEFALKASLLNAGVNDEKARNLLSREFDLDKLELDDKGEVKGIIDLLKPIKENAAFKSMFGTTRMVGQEHIQGEETNPLLGEYANKNPYSKATLNLTQQVLLQKTQPELAARLRTAAGI